MTVQEALALLAANPMPPGDTSSLLPWYVEGPRILSADGSDVAACWSSTEARHLLACAVAAPVLHAQLAAIQVAVAEVCNPVHSANCRRNRLLGNSTECICDAYGKAISKARRAAGLE